MNQYITGYILRTLGNIHPVMLIEVSWSFITGVPKLSYSRIHLDKYNLSQDQLKCFKRKYGGKKFLIYFLCHREKTAITLRT